jgi:O-antigen ligase
MAQSYISSGIGTRGPTMSPLSRAAGAVLIFLLVAFPVVRILLQLCVPNGGSHTAMSLITGALEVIVVTLALSDRALIWPKFMSWPRWVHVLTVLWFAWAAIAVALSAGPLISAIRQLEWVIHGVFGIAVCAYLMTYEEWRPALLRCVVVGFLFYAVAITFLLFLVPDPESYPWVGGVIGFVNVRHFGYFVMIALVAAHANLVRQVAIKGNPAVPLIILTVIYAYLAWAGGRAPYLGLACTFLVLVFAHLPNWRRVGAFSATALVLGGMISIPFTPPNGSFGVFRFLTKTQVLENPDAFSSGRIEMWTKSLEMVEQHPIFGIGPNQFRMTLGDSPIVYLHPHDGFLQTALEWGVPGAILFWCVLGWLLTAGWRRFRENSDPELTIGFALALSILFTSTVDGTLRYAMPLSALSLAFALVFSSGGSHHVIAAGDASDREP